MNADEIAVLKERLSRLEEVFKRTKAQQVTSKLLDTMIASFVEAGGEGDKELYDKAIVHMDEQWREANNILEAMGKSESLIDGLNDFLLAIARDRQMENTEFSAYLDDEGIRVEVKNCPFLEVENILSARGREIRCCFPGSLGKCMFYRSYGVKSDYSVLDFGDTCVVVIKTEAQSEA
jgi:hypothetical protein